MIDKKHKFKRKYKRFEKFIPKDENMFWKEYKIVDCIAGTSKSERDLGFTYSVECLPKNADDIEPRTMLMTEKTLDTMENIGEKTEYKIKVVGQYINLGSKVIITERDPDTGMAFPYCTASVWVDESPNFEKDEFVLKTYSENKGLLETLLENEIITLVGPTVTSGRCKCPVVKLTGKTSWYA